MMIRTDIVYMIGHSNLPIEVFLSHLEHHRIEKVIDVRSVPRSRWQPQFNREPLRASLEQRRIGYQSLRCPLSAAGRPFRVRPWKTKSQSCCHPTSVPAGCARREIPINAIGVPCWSP